MKLILRILWDIFVWRRRAIRYQVMGTRVIVHVTFRCSGCVNCRQKEIVMVYIEYTHSNGIPDHSECIWKW